MLRAVCFDLDGTLLRPHQDFQQEVLAKLSSSLALTGWQRQKFEAALAHILPNEAVVSSEEAVHVALERSSLDIPDQLFLRIQPVIQNYGQTCEVAEHSLELLDFLQSRSILTAVITNGPVDMQSAALKQTGLETYFSAILISGDPEVDCRKPDKEIFELACQKLAVLPHETLMVGDNPVADCQGALGAGLQAIQVGHRKPKPAGVRQMPNMFMLLEYLRKII